MLRPTLSVDRSVICDQNARLRILCLGCTLSLLPFYLIGHPGSSDHSFPIGVLTSLYLFLHAHSAETKQELVVDFRGKEWHVQMLWGKDAAFNESFVVLKQIEIFGHDLGLS